MSGPVSGDEHAGIFGAAHDALSRMHRAARRGTGCHLTAEMIQSLSVTMIGQMWNEPDPREDADR